jgi:hypothetical protein
MVLQRSHQYAHSGVIASSGTARQAQQNRIMAMLTTNGDPLLTAIEGDLFHRSDAAGQRLTVSTQDMRESLIPLRFFDVK